MDNDTGLIAVNSVLNSEICLKPNATKSYCYIKMMGIFKKKYSTICIRPNIERVTCYISLIGRQYVKAELLPLSHCLYFGGKIQMIISSQNGLLVKFNSVGI